MAKIGKFDIDKHKMSDVSLIPAGTVVLAKIIKEEDKKTQSGGRMLTFEFEVAKGEYKGRKFWVNLNYENDNETTVEMALNELADITRACGFDSARKDTEELHKIEMICTMGVTKGKDDYGDKNKVKKYESVSDGKKFKKEKGNSSSKPPWEKEDEGKGKGEGKKKGKKKDK